MDVCSEYNMMVFVMLLGCLEICKIMIVLLSAGGIVGWAISDHVTW